MSLRSDDRLRFGVCYYPDHWPRERWGEDLRLMREAGLECIRSFEGAWTLMEPAEGRFDWSFVDAVLDACADAGLGVIMGTPTYAAPAWLEERHPSIIARRADGTAWYRHGRRYYDYTDPHYREACRRIVTAMAERYAADERVWAWQLDNELWCHVDSLWGDGVRKAFQDWLARRYRDVTALNEAWGMRFWSNQLDHFGQADLPGPTPAHHNHHQLADYRHFLSDLGIGFLAEQAEIVKKTAPDAQVLHNCPFAPVDRAALLERLDIYGHDHYPRFAPDGGSRPAFGLNYGRFRHYAKRLWVVEQQASQVGQTAYRKPTSPPGELAVSALQSIGHGCNLVAWFRWRGFPAAQETNWGGILPHWGAPGRYYQELSQLVGALRPHAATIAGTKPLVSVARLASFRQEQAHVVEPWIAEHVGPIETGRLALRALGLNEDVLRPADLREGGGYQVALLPHALALDADEILRLGAWVRAGGVLVVGPLAGHRDERLQGAWVEPPGPLRSLTGTANGEATASDGKLTIIAVDGGGQVEAGRYAEVLETRADDVRVVARHVSGWLAGRPAITSRTVGDGRVIHCGVPLSDTVLRWMWVDLHLPKPRMALATHEQAAEILTRVGDGYALHFALNHGAGPAVCYLYRQVKDLLSGETLNNSFTVSGYGWRILHEDLGAR